MWSNSLQEVAREMSTSIPAGVQRKEADSRRRDAEAGEKKNR